MMMNTFCIINNMKQIMGNLNCVINASIKVIFVSLLFAYLLLFHFLHHPKWRWKDDQHCTPLTIHHKLRKICNCLANYYIYKNAKQTCIYPSSPSSSWSSSSWVTFSLLIKCLEESFYFLPHRIKGCHFLRADKREEDLEG